VPTQHGVDYARHERRAATMKTLALAAILVLSLPAAAEAQQTTRIPRIGFLQPGARPATWVGGFRQGLRQRGYVEGHNIEIEYRLAQRQSDFPELVTDLVRRNVDVIVTWTTPAALAAKQATAAIPIVAITGNPVEMRLVASLARQGTNITGIAILTHELKVKNLELLKDALPSVLRVTVLWNPENPIWGAHAGPAPGRSIDARCEAVSHRGPGAERTRAGVRECRAPRRRSAARGPRSSVFRAPADGRRSRDAVPITGDLRRTGLLRRWWADVVLRELSEMLRRSATYVDKILKGARPADLPIEQSTNCELVINVKTAKVSDSRSRSRSCCGRIK
jgi:ABC transporter substrate binding protein